MNAEPTLGACPLPLPSSASDQLLLAHGEGARATRRLIRELMAHAFANPFLDPLGDAAVLPDLHGQAVLSTDSYVVSPLFFPGGDIGKLAVHGTINDLAVSGADPLYLSLAIIAEEGLPLETLRKVIESIRDAALSCAIPIVTGDTKVVPRGTADGLFLNTTGLGRLRDDAHLSANRIEPGDAILVSGTIGDHGLAILSAREQLEMGDTIRSDTTPLHIMVAHLLQSGVDVKFLRDATRGGVSAVCHELAEASGRTLLLRESALPISEPVRGACELLGLDPLYVANEGKLIAIVAAPDAERARDLLHAHPAGRQAAIIGEVTTNQGATVLVRGPLGYDRILDEPTGAPLPRIC